MSFPGLSSQDVAQRVASGHVNAVENRTSRSLASIVRANVFTLFNAILVAAMVVVLVVGTWKDAVFGFVMVANAVIGIVSEWRAKRTLDALSIIHAPQIRVHRDGKVHGIPAEQVVLDEVIELHLGDHIAVDAQVVSSDGLEVDESLLTGESVPVRKAVGSYVLAGTAVVSGSGIIQATAVGLDIYAQGITRQVKKFTRAVSEIQSGIDLVLRWISFFIVPVLVTVAWTQYRASDLHGSSDWHHAVVLAIAAVVGLIPQGLVLLTSMNFAVGSAKLAGRGVLVQELPAVEVLARVDALNVDKTGTLTTGGIRWDSAVDVTSGNFSLQLDPYACTALYTLNAQGTNATAQAVIDGLTQAKTGVELSQTEWSIPFTSVRKWSAVGMTGRSWYFGAPEILLDAMVGVSEQVREYINLQAASGKRVVLLAVSHIRPAMDDDCLPVAVLPGDLQAHTLVVLAEEVRPDAQQTLEFFRQQGVRVRVISGDNPVTVGAIAETVGLCSPHGGAARLLDARTLPDDMDSEEFRQAVRDHDVFGRVTPEQKRAMVHAQQFEGFTVAMTGDGVNDALALKDADLGIAMGNAASATKAVAQLVLVNGQFSVLPPVVAEGRRIIANMERVSALFLTKTVLSFVCIVATAVLFIPYPFLPRHFTYIGMLTIGVPAFVIALGPNSRVYVPGFLRRTLSLAIPVGLILAMAALSAYVWNGAALLESSTVAALSLMMGGLWLTGITARPWNVWRGLLIMALALLAVLGVLAPLTREFFALAWPSTSQWLMIAVCGGGAVALIEMIYRVIYRRVAYGTQSLKGGNE